MPIMSDDFFVGFLSAFYSCCRLYTPKKAVKIHLTYCKYVQAYNILLSSFAI